MAYTPGPWKFDKPRFGSQFVRQDPLNWNGMGYQLICTLPAASSGSHYGDMFSANARLIAAAPDLLTAAKEVMATLQKHGGAIVPHLLDTDMNAGQRLRDAIAKAESI